MKTDPENSDSEDGFLLTSDKWARIAARKVIRVCILHSAYIHQVLWARPHPDSFLGISLLLLSPRLLRRQESMWWTLWFSIYNEKEPVFCMRRCAQNTQEEEGGYFVFCVESKNLT